MSKVSKLKDVPNFFVMRRVTEAVEERLTRSPVVMPGFGLKQQFHDIFDPVSKANLKKKILERRY